MTDLPPICMKPGVVCKDAYIVSPEDQILERLCVVFLCAIPMILVMVFYLCRELVWYWTTFKYIYNLPNQRQRVTVGRNNPECVACLEIKTPKWQCVCGRYTCHECLDLHTHLNPTMQRACFLCNRKRRVLTPFERAKSKFKYNASVAFIDEALYEDARTVLHIAGLLERHH